MCHPGYRSYGDLIATHAQHKETKRTGPDGLPCEERTRGLLGRRTVRPLRVTYIGKEADRHEERDLAADLHDLITDYGDTPGGIEDRIICPALRTFFRDVAAATGIDPENLRKIANGKRKAQTETMRKIIAALATLCAGELNALGIQPPRRRLAAIKFYLDLRAWGLARLASVEAEHKHLETEQRADLHALFRYWHDVTNCWSQPTVRTRYHNVSVSSPRGRRSSWSKLRSVKEILSEACAELGEDFDTFASRVCQAIHERPRRIADLKCRVRKIREGSCECYDHKARTPGQQKPR
jgi:hypothetical protein